MSDFKVLLLFILISLMGFLLTPNIELKSEIKNNSRVSISYALDGATPELLEKEITSPLENVLSQINQIKTIQSLSNYGNGTINITFDEYADIEFKKLEVSSAIRRIYPKLRYRISYPRVSINSDAKRGRSPLLIYNISAPFTTSKIRDVIQDVLRPVLASIPGIKEIEIDGVQSLQVTIEYNFSTMKRLGISASQLATTISDYCSEKYPGSTYNYAGQIFRVKIRNGVSCTSDIENIVVLTSTGFIKLGSLANVFIEESKLSTISRLNGQSSVTLSIYPDNNINKLETSLLLESSFEKIKNSLPSGYFIEKEFDDSRYSTQEIKRNIIFSLVTGLILIGFAFFIYRSIWHSAIIVSGILITIGITFLFLFLFNININNYSFSAITLSVGFIVAHLIISIENSKHVNPRIVKNLYQATIIGCSILGAFYALSDESNMALTDFSASLLISLIIALLTSVFYCQSFIRITSNDSLNRKKFFFNRRINFRRFHLYSQLVLFLKARKTIFVIVIVITFGIPIFLLPKSIDGLAWYNKTIGNEYFQNNVKPKLDKILGGTFRLFLEGLNDRASYGRKEETKLFILAHVPQGNTIEELDRIMKVFEGYLASMAGVKKFVTTIKGPQSGMIAITFYENFHKMNVPFIVKHELEGRASTWSGVSWNIYGVGNGFSSGVSEPTPVYQVNFAGYNYDELEVISKRFVSFIGSNKRVKKIDANGSFNYEDEAYQFMLNIKSSEYNFNQLIKDIKEKNYPSTNGEYLQLNDDAYAIILKPRIKRPISYYEIGQTLAMSDSSYIKLDDISTIELNAIRNSILKKDRHYLISIGYEYNGLPKFGDRFLAETIDSFQKELPLGFKIEQSKWSHSPLGIKQFPVFLIVFVGIYVLCSIFLENFKLPLIIVSTILISFIGVFLTFVLFKALPFDEGGYISMIALMSWVAFICVILVKEIKVVPKVHNAKKILKILFKSQTMIFACVFSFVVICLPLVVLQNQSFLDSFGLGILGGFMFSLFTLYICLPVFILPKSNAKY